MSEILQELITCGVSPATILVVAKLIADAEFLTEKRAADRARQREHRARKSACHVTSRDVTGRHMTEPSSIEEERKKEENKKARESRATRATPIPENFVPDVLWAIEKTKWTSEKADSEAQRFKDSAVAHSRRYADWPAAWRNWVTSPFQSKGSNNGLQTNQRNGFQQAVPRYGSKEWRQEQLGFAIRGDRDQAIASNGDGARIIDITPQRTRETYDPA